MSKVCHHICSLGAKGIASSQRSIPSENLDIFYLLGYIQDSNQSRESGVVAPYYLNYSGDKGKLHALFQTSAPQRPL